MGGGYSQAAGRLRGHPRVAEMGSGDPEVLPPGLHRRCASVDPRSMSEDEGELPVISESAVAFPHGAQRPMLNLRQGSTHSRVGYSKPAMLDCSHPCSCRSCKF